MIRFPDGERVHRSVEGLRVDQGTGHLSFMKHEIKLYFLSSTWATRPRHKRGNCWITGTSTDSVSRCNSEMLLVIIYRSINTAIRLLLLLPWICWYSWCCYDCKKAKRDMCEPFIRFYFLIAMSGQVDWLNSTHISLKQLHSKCLYVDHLPQVTTFSGNSH